MSAATATATKATPKTTAKATTPEPVSTRFEAVHEGDTVKFFRIRANGTKRHVPTLTGDALATAQAIKAQREAGITMKDIATERHLSVSSVRRYLTSLALTEEVQAATAKPARRTRAAKTSKASASKASASA